MTISFDNIPAALRTPGVYIEFNNELAGATGLMHKTVVIGQRFDTGTVAAETPTRVTSASQAETFFGRGSMLAEMLKASLNAKRDLELWAIALDDNADGAAATGSVEFTGSATAAGTANLYIAGQRIQVAVANDATATKAATSVSDAINDRTDLPVEATATAGTVTLTARHKGEVGNTLDIRMNYYQGESLPAGITGAFTAMSGGRANPDINSAIAVMGDEWYNWIVTPYTDDANLVALETELNARWGPMRQLGARAFAAFRGTHAATGTFGGARNNPHLTVMGTNIAPQPPYIWAAVNAAVAASSLAIDPARPLQTLVLTGIMPPAQVVRWDQPERNIALFDGIATHTVDAGGQVRIERQITTYQKNASNLPDASYLDINTPETLERIRFEQRAHITQMYPRHKLAADGTNYGAGQAIVTPVLILGELVSLYREMELKGWVEDTEHYKNTMVVEINIDDKNRIDVNDQPNLVNQFRVHAQKTQFII